MVLLRVDVVLTKLEDTLGVEDEMENLGFHHKWFTTGVYCTSGAFSANIYHFPI